VAIARDGAQGLMLARDWSPDLILMDIMLPAVDGSTAIRRLKADPETAEIPIVAMSAGRTIRSQSEALAHADAALAKPFDIDALLAQVAFHLSRRPPEEQA
jgi:DNA-binding response OmpR family regulator